MMGRFFRQSISKREEHALNEDAVKVSELCAAVSDGAGGGGLFADLWAKYLLENLPEEPMDSFAKFDKWVDGIWERFYNECEEMAKAQGGLFLKKFYEEGSFATLAAAWRVGDVWQWMTYGDSVVFCYNRESGSLRWSDFELADFAEPPFLICSKDPLCEEGFRKGSFSFSQSDVLFVASDALSCYIMMMYQISKGEEFKDSLEKAERQIGKNSNIFRVALALDKVDFPSVMSDLLKSAETEDVFCNYVEALEQKGLLGHDDYSIAVCFGGEDRVPEKLCKRKVVKTYVAGGKRFSKRLNGKLYKQILKTCNL